MEKTLLKEIILEQQRDLILGSHIIKREKSALIKDKIASPFVIIVTGLRRVGKSVLLKTILNKFFPHGVYYLNFEDERLLDFSIHDFNLLHETFIETFGEKNIFFLDEIQNVPKWELFVRRMQDKKFKFFITGSNAALLGKELGTHLTGRHLSFELFPFSFREYLLFKNVEFSLNKITTRERGLIKKYFTEYVSDGGIPDYLLYQDPMILKGLYDDILYRDIVVRHDIKGVKSLRELALLLMSNVGCLISYNKLKNILNLGSVTTIKSYLQYLEDSYLFFSCGKFSYSLARQTQANKKIYCIDNGLANAVAFQVSKNKGRYLENLVFLELKREGHEIYYYHTSNNLEVDFLVRQGKDIVNLIQVTEHLNNMKTKDREITALLKAMEELKLKKGLILTEDDSDQLTFGSRTIDVMPIWRWLLAK